MTTTNRPQPPTLVRWASIIAILQAMVGLGYAGLLIYREIIGVEDPSLVSDSPNASWVGYGTAIFFAIIFGAVLAGAISLLRGRKWGRGPMVMLNIIFLPVSYYMFSEGLWAFGLVTAATAILVLVMMFNPRSIEWAEALHGSRG